MTILFPFSAVTGHVQAKKALLCALASNEIHSVLIMGDRGTGKSVLARSLGAIPTGKETLNLPQNITPDRLLGSIDLETAVSTGKVRHTPGILEQGNDRILYVDDINLMEEGVLTSILNTAESGEILLEREGISRHARTRFLLLATMDPAEGELTASQLDRFDLCVRLESVVDEKERARIIRSQIRFERDPGSFVREFEKEEEKLVQTISAARERLPYVNIPDGHAELISSVCLELGVSGQRGDLAAARAVKTLAALDGRDSVEFDDVKLAALLALGHRRRDIPESPPPSPPREKPDREKNDQQESTSPGRNEQDDQSPMQQPEERRDRNTERQKTRVSQPQEQVFAMGSAFEVIRYLDEESRKTSRKQKSGRRTRVISTDASGHYRSFVLPGKNPQDIAIDATLRAAAPYQKSRGKNGLAISVKKGDLREKVRERKVAHTILFLVDASGSMGARRRMVAVKGAILSLLTDAYQKRDRVGLMAFRGKDTRLLLPLTRSPDLAVRHLRTLPTGGMTPLTKGLADAYDMLTRGKHAAGRESRTLVILTDGRVNVPWKGGRSPYNELAELSRTIAGSGIRFIVVDTEEGFPRLGRARLLAGDLGATCFRLEDLRIRELAGMVQDAASATG